MKVLILQHWPSEGPGTIESFLRSRGAQIELLRLYDGHALPQSPTPFDVIVSLGGPMSVYDEDHYPFLQEETSFLREVIQRGLPVLGICLGAQMIAKACGAEVTKSPKAEIGWNHVMLTSAGKNDPAFFGLPESVEVFQWHNDMFKIPKGGLLLAYSADCPHQALRFREAVGLQFHIEVTPEILQEWFKNSPQISLDGLLEHYHEIEQSFQSHAVRFYGNFFQV